MFLQQYICSFIKHCIADINKNNGGKPMDKNYLNNINNSLNEFAESHPSKVKDWIIEIDRLMTEKGCKAKFKYYGRGGVLFDYYSKKAKARVCRIYIGNTLGYMEPGLSISLQANHFATPYSIVNELPSPMLHVLKDFTCASCRESCQLGVKINSSGGERLLCPQARPVRENPASEQKEETEWLIRISRGFVDFIKS